MTTMTIGDIPEPLTLGSLGNQGVLRKADEVKMAGHYGGPEAVLMRTRRATTYLERVDSKTRRSDSTAGAVFDTISEGSGGSALIGSIRAQRVNFLPGAECLMRDADPSGAPDEDHTHLSQETKA